MLFLLLGISQGAAQSERKWLGIETDPISTAFGALTLSVVVEPKAAKHWSLFMNIVSADFPNWMDDFLNPNNKGKGFDSKINIGGGLAFDYFLKEEKEGFYFGLINLFFQNEVRQNDTTETVITHNIIPRLGYRWYPLKKINIYLNPFVGLRYEHTPGSTKSVDGTVFEPAGIQPFGTLHIGFHF